MLRESKFCNLLILALAASIVLISSCESVYIEPEQIEIPPEGVSFSEDIIPIFDNGCNVSGCHVAGHFVVDLTPANAYADINAKGMVNLTNPEQSKLYAKLVESSGTHTNRSTPSEQQLILEWIIDGAKNN
jgi:hypothetical protein